MRGAALGMLLIGCWVSTSVAPPPPPPRAPAQQALVVAPPPAPTALRFFVAGCNTACIGCAIERDTYVIGTLQATGDHLFPNPNPPGPPGNAYSCSSTVSVGDTVTLEAHTSEPLELAAWRPFNRDDYCPCAGTKTRICRVTVTPEIAATYTRVYCGADWTAARRQIAH